MHANSDGEFTDGDCVFHADENAQESLVRSSKGKNDSSSSKKTPGNQRRK